VRKFAKLF